MKLIVKTLNGKQLPIEIDPSASVGEIKVKIEEEHQLKADTLKLIAYGKVLQSDDQKASEYNLKDGDFIVAMVQKAKPAPKPKPAPKDDAKQEEKPETTAAASSTAAAATTSATAAATASAPTGTAAASNGATASAAASQSLPPEVESAVTELIAISGKSREDCIRALAAANNMPDIAFEFLMSGNIPAEPIGGGPDGMEDDYGDEGDDGAGAGAGLG